MLSDNSRFGVQALTAAINKIEPTPSQIRELGLFKPEYLTTTYVNVECREGRLKLVPSRPRGAAGEPVLPPDRTMRTFRMTHLPIDDTVKADDVQNVRAFGTSQAETVVQKVNDRLADAKTAIEYTREHLMLGALQGKILDADGGELWNLYSEFGLTRKTADMKLGTAATEVGKVIDELLGERRSILKGAAVTGWIALCGLEFLTALKYHKSIKPLYERYRDGAAYREGNGLNPVEFEHNGLKFIQYSGDFGTNGAKIDSDKAILLPVGNKLYTEYFAPADMNETVNTRALPVYASREKLPHGKGWSLHIQSNPLPLILRPDLLATLTA